MKRTILPALAILLAFTATAAAINYGTGTFSGDVHTIGTSQRGSVVVKVVPGKARVKKIALSFNCTGVKGLPDRLRMPASSAYAKVKEGSAGGGATVRIEGARQVGGRSFEAVGKVFLGLRDDEVSGSFDARLRGDAGCGDTYGDLSARR